MAKWSIVLTSRFKDCKTFSFLNSSHPLKYRNLDMAPFQISACTLRSSLRLRL